jgi:membrane-associated phospholipid phosphatase
LIKTELEQLRVYMHDDRARYLTECDVQADGLPAYMIHFIGADASRHPWTIELVNCVLAIGNVAYMSYKAHYKRARPSKLMPGLTVPFGPPGHPAFPSGHSFVAHLLALMLLEIQGINQRLGVLRSKPNTNPPEPVDWELGEVLRKPVWADLNGTAPIASPLLTIARRLAVNRERIGMHYPSDTMAGRHLAAGLWDAMVNRPQDNPLAAAIEVPTLLRVLDKAKAEWPSPWA